MKMAFHGAQQTPLLRDDLHHKRCMFRRSFPSRTRNNIRRAFAHKDNWQGLDIDRANLGSRIGSAFQRRCRVGCDRIHRRCLPATNS